MLIKNTSDQPQAVAGFPAFAAGEVRTVVSKEDAKYLLGNPFLEEVKEPAKSQETQPEGNDRKKTK